METRRCLLQINLDVIANVAMAHGDAAEDFLRIFLVAGLSKLLVEFVLVHASKIIVHEEKGPKEYALHVSDQKLSTRPQN